MLERSQEKKMRNIVLALISASVVFGAPALGKSARELTHAHSRHAVLIMPFTARVSVSVPAHAAFRYRKGGRCHHYHYYKPVVPDC
jgi:hypothetical protein